MSLYLSRIEGPPPKRNAPGSNPGRDATKNAESLDFSRFLALLFLYESNTTRYWLSTVDILLRFGCGRSFPKNLANQISKKTPFLLMKIAFLLIG